MNRVIARLLAAAAMLLAGLSAAGAQTFPGKPIKILVGFPAGGPIDVQARFLAQKLAVSLGQPVVVDNRPGADGIIATNAVAKAEPDGYTLLLASIGYATVPSLHKDLPYDPASDLMPVIYSAHGPMVLVAHPDVPATTVAELFALARAKPGALNYGSAGMGSSNHLGMELLTRTAGVRMNHVPYKGAAPATTDLLSDRIQLMLNPINNVLPYLGSGKLRALGVTTAKRTAQAPDVPAIAETVSGFDVSLWSGFFAPRGTPADRIETLNRAIRAALDDPEVRKGLFDNGFETDGGTPQQFGTFVDGELERWKDLVTEADIKAE
jgi:tripartite-type tricarboxylate transporter receptor subunit TctC